MTTAQVTLSEQERATLEAIAAETGKSESQLLREAIEAYIRQFSQTHRLVLLRQARGMWADRTDLPDFDALRREFDRG